MFLFPVSISVFDHSFPTFVFRNNGNSSSRRHRSPNKTDRKRLHRLYQSKTFKEEATSFLPVKTFKVKISFAAKIPMQAITNALRGQELENSQEALRVLDIILSQHIVNPNNGNSNPYGHGIPNETDRKRLRCSYQLKTFKLKINFAVKIQMQAIINALCGQESENSQEALRDRDIHYFWSYNQDTDKKFNLLTDICSIRDLKLVNLIFISFKRQS
ncbi:Protein argonaute 4A [Capsicum chinense]|nr:Protein argonaute 4A [Capsicum chinense]